MAVNKMYPLEAGVRVAMYCKTNAVGLNFTAFGIGSGENLSPEIATALTKEEKRIPVTSVKKIDYGRYRIRGELSNTDLTEDIVYRELGLYCDDPENGGEVLYTYGNAKGADFDYTETIRCFADYGITVSKIFEIDIIIDNYIDPTFTIDDSGKVDIATVNELINDVAELGQEVEALKTSGGGASGEDVEALREDVERHNQEIESLGQEVETLGQDVEGLKNASANVAVNAETFTYVVDSDQKLADWANNVEGNDYTSVLIRKGEWTVSHYINLTKTKTLRIVGEAGSKIIFSGDIPSCVGELPIGSCEYALMFYYSDDGDGGLHYDPFQFYMHGVTIEAELSLQGTLSGMVLCGNLHNCHCKVTNTSYSVKAFEQCTYLHNCVGEAWSEAANRYAHGFNSCEYVTECKGLGYNSGSKGEGVGFSGCVGVSKCSKGHGSSNTALFDGCYASVGFSNISETYKVANTANGGFNNMYN